ncbi:hypothetical protein [Hubei myriapoda virus 9]|uniref:hypothetical protein n=1 Tax=Hubei myriapoda virus 9 TaxID=1922938 RepID=UPI00090CA3FB|nr:hypothetical protein [Hubei myriapoda virus 9]APG75639.1 hypothetical protein [Hubei myriapoda virus 9]APG75895.1 RdRp [Hubei myriapoda virus 9]APG75931.1 hypothetical protein 3 [Hubei myriapoda virus 9]APG75939.1 hypothetical protein 3 [Hubei myriapoda virus 9]APG75968.1 hypothetical protein 3 [Hubei myriapoda virus 9]
MFYIELLEKALVTGSDTGVVMGFNPFNGGYKHFIRSLPEKCLMLDKSSWDWTVPTWLLSDFYQLLSNLGFGGCKRFHRWRQLHGIDHGFIPAMVEGEDCDLPAGIQVTGNFLTYIGNSVMQLLLHFMAEDLLHEQPGRFYCGGDDSIQSVPKNYDGYLEFFQSVGLKVRGGISDHWEFLGWKFSKERKPVPLYSQKHLFNQQQLDELIAPDLLSSYQLLYTWEPIMLNHIKSALSWIKPEFVRSDWYLQCMWEGL